MAWTQALWLSVIQGLTEFLPISSSGHLALAPALFNWPDQGLAFDVAAHVGSLIAVLIYFHKDIILIIGDWLRSLAGGPVTIYSKLAWSIALATALVGGAGILLEDMVSTALRNPLPIAGATIVFGIILGATDKFGAKRRRIESISWKDVLVIGGAQVLALIPGTSRSGITISAGLMMGLTREAAARFSFLLAIPVIALAGIWLGTGLAEQAQPVQWSILFFATAVSAMVALLCIHYFLRYLQHFSLLPFMIYRLILGVILLVVFL
ncbi:undecaprenyl-diphosphate phosphatase [Candidatus Spongiihabitans sp.]|uniref:undecaprenyl-diphosphate phosphatase n=1 Tax=Candidatus Spongiihabitans sp. TaxID=3101308 RepID=UPI003C7C59DA